MLDRGDTPVKKWEILPFFGLCLTETGVLCDWLLNVVWETGLAPPAVAGFLDRKDFMLTVLSSISTNIVATIDKFTTDGVLKRKMFPINPYRAVCNYNAFTCFPRN